MKGSSARPGALPKCGVVDVPRPAPGKGQAYIRIVATSVTVSVCIARGLVAPFLYRVIARLLLGVHAPRRPIFGMVLAGVIESVGRNVTPFKPADEVFGLSQWKPGRYAEYVRWPAGAMLAARPANLSFDESAALPYGGLLAMHLLRRALIERGERIVVYGSSGAVGTAAVQLAKHLGASVTAVCSGRNFGLVVSLGADRLVDYTEEDFTDTPVHYDVILDAMGSERARRRCSVPEMCWRRVAESCRSRAGASLRGAGHKRGTVIVTVARPDVAEHRGAFTTARQPSCLTVRRSTHIWPTAFALDGPLSARS